MKSISKIFDDVKDRLLDEKGFLCNLSEETFIKIVAAGFKKSKLPEILVLAQILLENHPISVRGAFYRTVSSRVYPNTDKKYYRQACFLILKLRRAGLVPYTWVVDGTRTHYKPSSWSGLADFADTVRDAYRKDFWASQNDYLEVIVEKDAMAGVLRPVVQEYDVGLNIIRGNSSESFVWALAERLREIRKPIHIYYLGDHDPNGLDIERDIQERLRGFMRRNVSWNRLAITSEEFKNRYDLNGFPVRMSGNAKAWRTRCKEYIRRFGDKCIEVDAVSPVEIRQRLKETIESHINQVQWENLKRTEALERETISKFFVKDAA